MVWALLSCHPLPAQHLRACSHAASSWPFSLHQVTKEKIPLPLDLDTVEAFWEFSQNPMGILLPLPKFSLCCIFVSFSHDFLPVVLSSKKLLHWSQHHCKTSRIYSFPSSIESKVRHCLLHSRFKSSASIDMFSDICINMQPGSFLFTHNISRSTQKDSHVSCTVSCPWSRSVPAKQFEDDSRRKSEIQQFERLQAGVSQRESTLATALTLPDQPALCSDRGKEGTAQCDLCFRCCTETHPCILHLRLTQQEVNRDDALRVCNG